MSNPTRLLPGTVPQLLNPFRPFGDNVSIFRKPVEVMLTPNPLPRVDTSTGVDLFRNARPAPGTKPTYGFLMPGRF